MKVYGSMDWHRPRGTKGKRGGILADPAVMLSRLLSCFALAFTGSVTPDLSSHRIVDTVKGSKLSYMALALQREPTACNMLATDTCEGGPGRP